MGRWTWWEVLAQYLYCARSFQKHLLPNTWHQKPSTQAVHCRISWMLTISCSQTKGRLAFRLQGISSIPVSHKERNPVKGFPRGPGVGLASGCVPSFWAIIRDKWCCPITTDSYPSMKLAEKLLKHQIPFWWGQSGTTPGNRIHGDERALSSMPLNHREKQEVETAPAPVCLSE